MVNTHRIIKSASLTAFVFSFSGWLYIAAIALVHPKTLELQLTHLTPWIREDTFGMICFVISAISFFIWNILREDKFKPV